MNKNCSTELLYLSVCVLFGFQVDSKRFEWVLVSLLLSPNIPSKRVRYCGSDADRIRRGKTAVNSFQSLRSPQNATCTMADIPLTHSYSASAVHLRGKGYFSPHSPQTFPLRSIERSFIQKSRAPTV